MAAIGDEALTQLVSRAIDEVGAALSAALVVMGDKLDLYRALAGAGPLTPGELAERTGVDGRYVREWLNAQAAAGYVRYEPATCSYTLPAEHAVALTDESSPLFLPGLFQIAVGSVADLPRVLAAARTGDSHERNEDVAAGCERFFRRYYNAHLVADWLPSLDGVVEKLEQGAFVADLGCGHGSSTIAMALAYPDSTFVGYDDEGAVAAARSHAREAGIADRALFVTAAPARLAGAGFDLVTMFDRLHEVPDPVDTARHVRKALAPDGTWMVVEPAAGDRVQDNLNPIGRAYYGLSALLCAPASLSTQAGEGRLREVIACGGFTRIRRAARTPLSVVLEARR